MSRDNVRLYRRRLELRFAVPATNSYPFSFYFRIWQWLHFWSTRIIGTITSIRNFNLKSINTCRYYYILSEPIAWGSDGELFFLAPSDATIYGGTSENFISFEIDRILLLSHSFARRKLFCALSRYYRKQTTNCRWENGETLCFLLQSGDRHSSNAHQLINFFFRFELWRIRNECSFQPCNQSSRRMKFAYRNKHSICEHGCSFILPTINTTWSVTLCYIF